MHAIRTRGWTKGSAVMAVVGAALLLGTQPALAQSGACQSATSASRLGTQVALSALATGLEYQSMARSAAWRMADESAPMAIVADPSSHLHALGSYHLARTAVHATCADRASRVQAAWKSAGIALAIGAAKEVADGYYNGFSAVDLGVDAMGAGYAVAQAYLPVLEKITPSFSVAPRAFLSTRGPRGALVDYAHQTVWLSANVHDLLPATAAKAWPSPVRLSVGRRAFGGTTPSEYVVGLDLDAARLPGNNPVWVHVKNFLHSVRLPGPALVMSGNGTKSFGLYW
jgi:hypothetical protein